MPARCDVSVNRLRPEHDRETLSRSCPVAFGEGCMRQTCMAEFASGTRTTCRIYMRVQREGANRCRARCARSATRPARERRSICRLRCREPVFVAASSARCQQRVSVPPSSARIRPRIAIPAECAAHARRRRCCAAPELLRAPLRARSRTTGPARAAFPRPSLIERAELMSTDRSDSSSAEPGRAASRAPLGEGRPAPSQPADTPSSAARAK